MSTYQQHLDRVESPAHRRGVTVALAAAAVFGVVTVGPAAVTASRAVANLPVTAVAVAWGRAHDGDCDVHGDLTVTCASMDGGYTNAGTTFGNTWLYGDLDGADRHRHESRHSDQWAMFGPSFPALYGAESARTRGDFHRNVFERWAGLHDGGYGRD
jgi:hypothetical protein